MNKLETAKQAAIDAAIQKAIAKYYPALEENINLLCKDLFDAGVAYQGEWTAVEDELPTKSDDYLVEMESPYSYQTKWYNPELLSNGTPAGWEGDSNIIRWREIPKYQPDGGEGE